MCSGDCVFDHRLGKRWGVVSLRGRRLAVQFSGLPTLPAKLSGKPRSLDAELVASPALRAAAATTSAARCAVACSKFPGAEVPVEDVAGMEDDADEGKTVDDSTRDGDGEPAPEAR